MPDLYLAIDIGGTKLTAGVVDERGTVVIRDRVPTPPRDVWPALARLVKRVVAASPVPPVACGVGCGGPLVPSEGLVSPLYIPSWRGFALRDLLVELTGLPTVVDTDAKAIASGEAWHGAGQGVDDFIGVVVATGVGGGIVSRGRLLQGRMGNAGHIGHIVVEPDGRPCACGGFGCLDAYCSRQAIELETGRAAQRAPRAIIERTGTLVGRALVSVGALVDLQLAVIGGTLALGYGEPFFDAVRHEVSSRAGLSYLQGFTVVPVSLGHHAPLVGAAALAGWAPARLASTPPGTAAHAANVPATAR
ncbi:MAG: ROK family protein [Ilumatobacteraceae bacterium]